MLLGLGRGLSARARQIIHSEQDVFGQKIEKVQKGAWCVDH
jgi:hypothetical protein